MPSEFRIDRLPDAAAFLDAASGFLLTAEAEHSLLLGIASGLTEPGGLDAYSGSPRFFTVRDDAGLTMAGLQTPPYNIVLSRGPATAAARLAECIAADGVSLPGTLAPDGAARAFADAWSRQTGATTREAMRQRVHCLTEVRCYGTANGQMRAAHAGDAGLLAEWLDDFNREAGVQVSRDGKAVVNEALARGRLFVWDDGGPVATAFTGRPTAHGISVFGVYTPPELRNRGYATGAVAAVSRHELDAGRQFCVLHTDLANPTSNHIYRQIGYEPVCDVVDLRFDYPPA